MRMAWRELLDTFVLGLGDMGSFDCVAVRFADRNFVQDDKSLVKS